MRWRTVLVSGVVLSLGSILLAQEPATSSMAAPLVMEQPVVTDSGPSTWPKPTAWATGEYLVWGVKEAPVPVPLVSAGNVFTLGPSSTSGVVGLPGTQVLIGGRDLDFDPFSGARFTLGTWLGQSQVWGIDGNYFFLADRAARQLAASPGLPPLSIPFFNALLNAEDSTGLAVPSGPNGSGYNGLASLEVRTKLQGAEINGLLDLSSPGRLRWHCIGGFRYLNLEESLTFKTISTNLPPLPRDVFRTRDQVETRNNFSGYQIGLRAEYVADIWYVNVCGKIAFGGTDEDVRVEGRLVTNDFTGYGPVQVFPAGYFALPSNIGQHHDAQFAILPEVDVNVGCQVTPSLRAFVGYTFLYLSQAVRPGDQLDRIINPSQGPAFTGVPSTVLAGPARPMPRVSASDFWVQGLNFGIELQY
ncbi:MAG: BBP7 family outer membrane beta-barrel protein [Gemmataceae bacterium]|nr:BBP7 family outer membrane beta-barrel protein [Gemmataceae bacterium]MDW8266139.1 BBP7 family outer membrane beta-barrel protein [Gemmataceae bacterium]